MVTKKNTVIVGVICFVLGAAVVKLYWPNVEIKIEKPKVSSTVHTTDTKDIDINIPEECQVAKDCSNSKLNVDLKAEKDKIFGRVWDDCKYVDFEFKVKARTIPRHIFQMGFGWTLENGYYLSPGYLYKTHLWDIAIGGRVIVRQYDPGAEIMIQKALF